MNNGFLSFVPKNFQIDVIVEKIETLHQYKQIHEPIGVKNYFDDVEKENQGLIFIDMDETLTCTEKFNSKERYDGTFSFKSRNYGLKLRPFLKDFLLFCRKEMKLKMILFTVAEKKFAQEILKFVDFKFDGYLFRNSVSVYERKGKKLYIKDVSKFSNCLQRTLLLDNSYTNFLLNTFNGIYIKDFLPSSKNDEELKKLQKYLKELVSKSKNDKKGDFRIIIKKNYSNRINTIQEFEKEILNIKRIKNYFKI